MSGKAASRSIKGGPINYFRKERIALKIVGISLTGDESIAYKMYSFLMIVFINCLYPLLGIREVFINDFDVVLNMIMYVFATLLGSLKALVVLQNRMKLGKILNKLEQEPFLPNEERGGDMEQKLIEDCLRVTNAQTMIYWVSAFTSAFVSVIGSLTKRIRSSNYQDWELPYGPLSILNNTYSPNYEISWFYQNFSILWIIGHFTTVDLISAGVLAHINFQFKMLQNNFQRIVTNSYRKMVKQEGNDPSNEKTFNYCDDIDNSIIPLKYLRMSIKEAIDYHLAIIDMSKEMEDVFSTLMLLIFFCTLGMLCFMVYHASILSFDDSRIVSTIGEALSSCLQIGMICYWGNQVMLESQEIGKAVYESNFVGTNLKFQQDLILIIRRSKNPTKITAGKFTDICLDTFTWFLRTSYSAFMILHNRSVKRMEIK